MDISSKPKKTPANANITEYLFSIYYADFEFVSSTYTGKVGKERILYPK